MDLRTKSASGASPSPRRIAAIGGALVAFVITAVGQASALDNQPGGGGANKTRKELEDSGYSCEYIATNFWECTKDGQPNYWCDSTGQCIEQPIRYVPPVGQAPLTPGGVVLNPTR